MYEDRIGLEKCLPRQQDKCRERHVQAAINAPHVVPRQQDNFAGSATTFSSYLYNAPDDE